MSYKYQNISDQKQTITGSGNITPREVEPNGYAVSDVAIENPNFKFINESQVQESQTEQQATEVTQEDN